MNRGGGGDEGKTWWPFATMLERADTAEAIGLNQRASALLDQFAQREIARTGQAAIHFSPVQYTANFRIAGVAADLLILSRSSDTSTGWN